MKSKATGCGSISTVFASIVLLCVSLVIIMMMMMMIIRVIIIIIIIIIIIACMSSYVYVSLCRSKGKPNNEIYFFNEFFSYN